MNLSLWWKTRISLPVHWLFLVAWSSFHTNAHWYTTTIGKDNSHLDLLWKWHNGNFTLFHKLQFLPFTQSLIQQTNNHIPTLCFITSMDVSFGLLLPTEWSTVPHFPFYISISISSVYLHERKMSRPKCNGNVREETPKRTLVKVS